jgi:hypothetical protein
MVWHYPKVLSLAAPKAARFLNQNVFIKILNTNSRVL